MAKLTPTSGNGAVSSGILVPRMRPPLSTASELITSISSSCGTMDFSTEPSQMNSMRSQLLRERTIMADPGSESCQCAPKQAYPASTDRCDGRQHRRDRIAYGAINFYADAAQAAQNGVFGI